MNGRACIPPWDSGLRSLKEQPLPIFSPQDMWSPTSHLGLQRVYDKCWRHEPELIRVLLRNFIVSRKAWEQQIFEDHHQEKMNWCQKLDFVFTVLSWIECKNSSILFAKPFVGEFGNGNILPSFNSVMNRPVFTLWVFKSVLGQAVYVILLYNSD